MAANEFIIQQISVFSENRPGRLAAIAHALEEERVNIFAFSIAEASGFGVVRALVDHPARAHDRLTQDGFNVAFTDVIAVRMRDEPGGLYEVARLLGEAGINIEYTLRLQRAGRGRADPPRGPARGRDRRDHGRGQGVDPVIGLRLNPAFSPT